MPRNSAADVRRSKTESLSLRLDPKTKFILEFVARINGQSITTVVERAIKAWADDVRIPEFDSHGNQVDSVNWKSFWDPNEGVRTLKLLASESYPTNYEEDELREFTLIHWEFFYTDPGGRSPRRTFLEILWPDIQRYLDIWRKQTRGNFWAAGEAMKASLSAANVASPHWPRKITKAASASKPPGELDDEIPF